MGIFVSINQKKCLGALNATQKYPSTIDVIFFEKMQEMIFFKWPFLGGLPKKFRKSTLKSCSGLLHCFQGIKTLHWSYQNQHSDNFTSLSLMSKHLPSKDQINKLKVNPTKKSTILSNLAAKTRGHPVKKIILKIDGKHFGITLGAKNRLGLKKTIT